MSLECSGVTEIHLFWTTLPLKGGECLGQSPVPFMKPGRRGLNRWKGGECRASDDSDSFNHGNRLAAEWTASQAQLVPFFDRVEIVPGIVIVRAQPDGSFEMQACSLCLAA